LQAKWGQFFKGSKDWMNILQLWKWEPNDGKNYEVEGCDKSVVYQDCWSCKISMWVETKKECWIM
jgi:hypothetical protein